MPGSAKLYFRDSADCLVRRSLDGLVLLYHRPSCITHIVDSPLPEILAALTEQPQSAEALMAALAEQHDLDGDVAGLEQHLDALTVLGLARAAP
jgi:PqqD family protein of HPr-rel-A system